MANCIDCVHFDVCQYDEQERAEANLESSYRDLSKYIADGCKFFKNKADFVEVVRCKDCVCFSYFIEPVKGYIGKCGVTQVLKRDDNFFCRYGIRKMAQQKEGAE